ncbi:hypothetical protein ACIGCP_17560 [Cellulophaga baltica]
MFYIISIIKPASLQYQKVPFKAFVSFSYDVC